MTHFIPLFLATLISIAPITLRDVEGWREASQAQIDKLPKDQKSRLVDYSFFLQNGGYAMTIYSPLPFSCNRSAFKGAIEGYETALRKSGFEIVSSQPGSLGRFRGMWMFGQGDVNGRKRFFADLLIFADRGFIIVVHRADQPIRKSDPFVSTYDARLVFDSSLEAGDIERKAPVNRPDGPVRD